MYDIDRLELTPQILSKKALLVEPLLNICTIYSSTIFPRDRVFDTVTVVSDYVVKNY